MVRAGKAAEARNAFKEALEDYEQAIALIQLTPANGERELALRQSAFILLRITKGFTAPETLHALESATALAEKSGNLGQLADWVMSRCLPALIAGDLCAASMFADQALGFALREGLPTRLAHVQTLQVLTHYWSGDFAGAEKHFSAGLQFFDNSDFRQSPRGGAVIALGTASWNAWTLGKADVARDREAQMMAAAIGNKPQNIAAATRSAAYLHACMREYEAAAAYAAKAVALSEEHQLPYFASLSRCILGYARAQLGQASEGIGLLRQGIAGLLEVGSCLGVSQHTAYLAEAQEKDGAPGDALETIDQALDLNPGERAHRPESIRVRGEIYLKAGHHDLAERDFRESIILAQSMNAKAWELRTTMSLARLLRDTNRIEEASIMLAEIYGWFTEGFDTADLKDARALLDELCD